MSLNFIVFNEVFFGYNKNSSIIDYLSFNITKGDCLVVKGESGTGKTTVFRLLLGFEQPDAGEIRYKDQLLDASTIKQLRRETAWLPQDLNLGSGPLREVFYYPFKFAANKENRPDEDTVLEVLRLLGLNGNLWETDFSDLSTGQRQRVGIALCHLLDKPLLLLDEPTSALDQRSKQRVADLLFDKNRTILSASHDSWWIERCDKIIELN